MGRVRSLGPEGFLELGDDALIQRGKGEEKEAGLPLLEKKTPEWTKSYSLGVRLGMVLI